MAAPGNMEFVIIVMALSPFSRNKSFLGALSYPYTVAMMMDAVILTGELIVRRN
jgi:hypothetical protein